MFGDNVYQQISGGAIGLRLTGVDDINIVVDAIEKGTRYVNGELIVTEEAKIEDELKNEDETTFNVIKNVGDDLYEFIKLTAV